MQNLLFLAHRIPFPPTKGDKVRSYHLLKHLSSRYRVHLGAFIDDEADLAYTDNVAELCQSTHLIRLAPGIEKVKSLRGLLFGEALTLPYYRSAGMTRWVNALLEREQIDTILVFSAAMAQYVEHATHACRVADLVDVDSYKWAQYAQSKPWPQRAIYAREGRKLLEYEREIAREFDATVFVSAAEAKLFVDLAPESAERVWHVTNGVDADYFSPERSYVNPYGDGERAIVFTGAMDYWPNVDAAIWFARSIFPEIHGRFPKTRFYVVGARPCAEIVTLAELPGVKVTGTVPDVRPFLAHAVLAVAPLRIARGIQNKVLEAMAMAKPVIATREAAEGIDARAGELMQASNENEFVEGAAALLQNRSTLPIGAAARRRVLESYTWDANLSMLERLLRQAPARNPACSAMMGAGFASSATSRDIP